MKQGRLIFMLFFLTGTLSGCLGTMWSGANLVYDRHDVFKKLSDYNLLLKANNALYVDKQFKAPGCVIDLTVFNGDILLAGHLPSSKLQQLMRQRIRNVTGFRRLFNEVIVHQGVSNNMEDTWITTKIRSQIFADDSIDPNSFKIITTDKVVYLMGDVKKDEAEKVIHIARNVRGVVRVANLLKYFTYQTN